MTKIDSCDKKIIYELDKDARQTAQAIAKKVQLSKVSVINRINKLESSGVIAEFIAQLNYRKLGYANYHVYYSFQNLSTKKGVELIDYLRSIKEIIYIIKLDSRWDIMIALLAQGNEDADIFLNRISQRFGDFIKDLRVYPIVRTFYPGRDYLIDTKPKVFVNPIVREKIKIEKVDSTDIKILRAVSQNARSTLIELEKRTKIKSEIIRYRLKNLVKNGIIQRFTINLNNASYGNFFYKIFIKVSPSLKEEDLMSEISVDKYSLRTHHIMAEKIVEADFEVPDYNEIRRILKNIKEKFGDKIQELEILPVEKIVKIGYNPL